MSPSDDHEPLDDSDREAFPKRLAERLMPERFKRVVDAGVGKLAEQPENLRHFVQELRVPKEVGSYLITQIDETKNGLYRAVAGEIRGFLEHTNLADELTKALTKLSFEIRMVIRFVPNESSESVLPKAKVQSEVMVKEESKAIPKKKRTTPRGSRSSQKRT